jgi:hypothetical protein
VHLEVDGRRSTSFPWATVAADRLEALAEQAALRMLWMAEERGRWFALLGKGATRS